jgi:hypothetical protein
MHSMSTFDLYIEALRRLAICQARAAAAYERSNQPYEAARARRTADQAIAKVNRLCRHSS